jgi:hypothetical protein
VKRRILSPSERILKSPIIMPHRKKVRNVDGTGLASNIELSLFQRKLWAYLWCVWLV